MEKLLPLAMKKTLIKNGKLVSSKGLSQEDILIVDGKISEIGEEATKAEKEIPIKNIIDASGSFIFPGAIDDQVHFREPGLTHKGTIYTEAKAAVAGGVTSFMEMPNTIPNVFTQELLENKYQIAAESSLANYSFYIGASNENIDQILKTDPEKVCGIKIFMGSSTGNMLVDNKKTLEKIFSESQMLIATHCEDEQTIQHNTQYYQEKFGNKLPIKYHPIIRSEEACYKSSSLAAELAVKHNSRLHILHISTKKEIELFSNKIPLREKKITAEACIHHLWFDDSHYDTLGTKIKWNPAVKRKEDKDAILAAVIDNRIDVIATDHAPHTWEEKQNQYFQAPSGGPLIQHSLIAMMELYHQGKITIEKIAEKMCHAPAELFKIKKRGHIKKGYWADLAIVNPNSRWRVTQPSLLYKCKWSPFEGQEFQSKVTHTFVNGNLVFQDTNEQSPVFEEKTKGQRLQFER